MRLLYLDIDTLRADHLGCYGYHRATTPNIDALAAEGVRFANVYASDVPCLPSRAALMSGDVRHPQRRGQPWRKRCRAAQRGRRPRVS